MNIITNIFVKFKKQLICIENSNNGYCILHSTERRIKWQVCSHSQLLGLSGIGSAGKAREAATGLLMAIWAKIVRSIFFLQILHIYLFLIHFTKYQTFRKSEQQEKSTVSVLFCLDCLAHACKYFEILPNKPHMYRKVS